jgi:mannose-6-phosphate isomerase-like protein (cupin superfamily)
VKTHTDDRRTIIDWGEGRIATVKALTMKQDATVGDHYHKNKDEHFLLLSGRANKIVIGDTVKLSVDAPHEFHVPRNTYHRFELMAGSVLLGTASEVFDPTDEIKGQP